MRGSRDGSTERVSPFWIIPAHAGLTKRRRWRWVPKWDHPRACGAHVRLEVVKREETGSSPRMRGSRRCDKVNPSRRGIIPAHAGLTSPCHPCPCPGRDHPRACGAHLQLAAKLANCWGSSPRMRGSLALAANVQDLRGIIPAHAGLTKRRRWRWVPKWDHPRACGAHSVVMMLSV